MITDHQADIGAFREDALSEQDAREAQDADPTVPNAMMADLLDSMKALTGDEARRSVVARLLI